MSKALGIVYRTMAEPRLSLTKSGNVRYELKTPYRDGTTYVIFDALDLAPTLKRPSEDHRLHRRPDRDCEDSDVPQQKSRS